jgi:asparagine synthase (glutamine-hydrolysing)
MGAHAGVLSLDGTLFTAAERPRFGDRRHIDAGAEVESYADRYIAIASCTDDRWVDQGRQLARSPRGLVLAFDGRLDNRHDLLLRLGQPLDRAGDAAIAAAAFERWGIDGLGALIGEWSAALWDPTERILCLARDYMGARPLYYAAGDRRLWWSTSLREIAVRADRVDAIEERFVAAFMTLRFSSEVTPYVDIHGVPAATAVTMSPLGGEERRRFWRLSPGTIRFRDRRDYEHGLRALFSDAVAARLRTAGTVWAELSGGFDSSAVVCMADALVKDGQVAASAIQPISFVTLQSPEGDERRYIAEVEARVGRDSLILGVEEHYQQRDEALDALTPLAASGVALAGAEQLQQLGGRVVLTGRSGDIIMGCDPYNSSAVSDDIARGDLVSALANIRRWSRAARRPFIEVLWDVVCRTAAPRRGLRAGPWTATSVAGGDLLTTRLQRLVERERRWMPEAVRGVRASKVDLAMQLLTDASSSQLNIPETPEDLCYSHPYTHRPLVEYVLAIPGEELSAPGEMRSLMRRAFAGLVPGRILRRVSKGYYPPSTARNVRALVSSMPPIGRLQVVERGWIDPERLAAAIATLGATGTSGSEVRRVLRLEQWLEARQRRAPADIPTREEVKPNEVLNP